MAVRCSALILPSKPLLVFANIGRKWAGSVTSTSRVTNSIKRCPQDTPTLNAAMKYYTSTTEFQLRNRSARAPDVRLRHGSPGQKTGPHQCQGQRLRLLAQAHRALQAQPHRLLRVHVRVV